MKKKYMLMQDVEIAKIGTLKQCKDYYKNITKNSFGTRPMTIYEISKEIIMKRK